MVKIGHNYKDVSEIFRLKEHNPTVMRLCAKEKNNLFYLCLDKYNEESEEYLMMMGASCSSKSIYESSCLKERNKSSRSSSKRLRT